jgi:hypothetical protein
MEVVARGLPGVSGNRVPTLRPFIPDRVYVLNSTLTYHLRSRLSMSARLQRNGSLSRYHTSNELGPRSI